MAKSKERKLKKAKSKFAEFPESSDKVQVLDGFVREDMMREYERLPPGKPFEPGTTFLRREVTPVVGTYVKMQVNCVPMYDVEFGEMISGCLMGGRVHTVRNEKHVFATMSATNIPAPLELESDWDVELVLEEEFRHPWVMKSMKPRMAN